MDVNVLAFVLMSNHFHLLIQTPGANLDAVMHYLLTKVSQSTASLLGRTDHILGKRYKWTIITNEIYISNVYRYILQNPIRAKICDRVEEYPFSTVHSMMSEGHPAAEIVNASHAYLSPLPPKVEDRLGWLNTHLSSEEVKSIKRGLRRTKFLLQ